MTARKVQFYVVKMDEVRTLRQVCRITGVTRRAIQGYEKAGLVHPSGHNERGYLLYNAEGIQRIQKIREYQKMGFSLNEIRVILNSSKEHFRMILSNQKIIIEEEILEKKRILKRMDEMME